VPSRGGIGQIHRYLRVLDPARGATVLALHPDTVVALLDIAGLIDHQDRTRISERADDVVTQIIAHGVGIPASPPQ